MRRKSGADHARKIGPILAAAAAVGAGLCLAWACVRLPFAGRHAIPYGDWANAAAPGERHSPESVAAVTFDFRGFDTFGEECILFAAVFGIGALLRRQPEDSDCPSDLACGSAGHPFEALRPYCAVAMPPLTVYGIYTIFHGHLSPGGGFQGGALIASAALLAGAGGRFESFCRLAHPLGARAGESAGLLGYAITGLIGATLGGAFLRNVLPMGSLGKLLSAGTLPVLNVCAGLAVAFAFLSLFREMLGQARRQAPREGL